MGRFYGERIRKGEIIMGDVPKLWRKATREWLDKNGTNSDKE